MALPELNAPLPQYSLPATVPGADGIATRILSNADLSGRPYVLFVYPRDNTEGCTVEACSFAALYPEFSAIGVQVVGISRDTVRSHINFTKKQELPYPLLSDEGPELLKSWGLLVNKTMYGKPVTGVARITYFVDAAGVVRRVWEKVSPPGHAAAVLEYAREFTAQSG